MMSSGSYSAWMDARNIEDVWDGYDPDWDCDERAAGPSDPYGDMSSDWLDWQDYMPLPDEDEAALDHRDALAKMDKPSLGGSCRYLAWNKAWCGDFEMRLGGCLDSGLN